MEYLQRHCAWVYIRAMHSAVFWWEVGYTIIDLSPGTQNAWGVGKPNLGWGCFTSARRSSRQTRGVCIAVFHVADHTCSRTLGCRYLEYRFPLSYLVSLQGEGNSFKTLGSWSLLGSWKRAHSSSLVHLCVILSRWSISTKYHLCYVPIRFCQALEELSF